MTATKEKEAENMTPLQLTSQYARGEDGANVAAVDAQGRDWYHGTFNGTGVEDQDFPVWPPCVACGRGVDWPNDPHWYHASADPTLTDDLFLHDTCATLVYPSE